MRKILAFLLVLIMLLPCVSACADKKPSGTLSFSEFLNKENFVHGISQGEFEKQMKSYSYKGKPITEILIGCNEDGLYGGGYRANGELFGFENMYRVDELEEHKDYYNSFYTEVELEGLAMPYNIEFTDTLTEALCKIGIEIDPYERFANGENYITLSSDKKSSTTLSRVQVADDAEEYDYVIEYTEIYNITNKSKQNVEVTRTVNLWFTGGYSMFENLYVKVNERR